MKASEQYGMYSQLSKDLEHYIEVTRSVNKCVADLLNRVTKLEDSFKMLAETELGPLETLEAAHEEH